VELSQIKGFLANDGIIYDAQTCDLDVLREMDTYFYDDMRPTDIVLDIGANIGAFSNRVAKNVQRVYAVEPVFPEALATNVLLNNLKDKVTVFHLALATQDIVVTYGGKTREAHGKTLDELVQMCGGRVDFLKLDCEGGEWVIKPEELAGIRRIEAEIHPMEHKDPYTFAEMLRLLGYEVIVETPNPPTIMVHAFMK
jgi:FkbM family methyltransferase